MMKQRDGFKKIQVWALASAMVWVSGCDYLDKSEHSGEAAQQAALSKMVLALNPNDKLTAHLENVPLAVVATELSKLAGLSVSYNAAQNNQSITLSFEDLPLQAGVMRIFGPDVTAVFPKYDNLQNSIRTGECAQPLIASERAAQHDSQGIINESVGERHLTSEQLLDRALHSPDSSVKIAALDAIAHSTEFDPQVVVETFEAALNDPDSSVRKAALEQISLQRIPVADDVIHDLAINDADDQIRGKAWVELVDRGDPQVLREFLPDALSDPNPEIRRSAKIQLDKLKTESDD